MYKIAGTILVDLLVLGGCGISGKNSGYEIGQAIREAIEEGMITREDIFVTTKIYPGSEMENPGEYIQACLERLDMQYR